MTILASIDPSGRQVVLWLLTRCPLTLYGVYKGSSNRAETAIQRSSIRSWCTSDQIYSVKVQVFMLAKAPTSFSPRRARDLITCTSCIFAQMISFELKNACCIFHNSDRGTKLRLTHGLRLHPSLACFEVLCQRRSNASLSIAPICALVSYYARDVDLKVFEFHIISRREVPCVLALAFRWWIVIIKIAGVGRVFDLWNNRPLDFAVIQSIPVDGFEEFVGFDQCCAGLVATRNVSEALRGIDCAKSADEIASIRWHLLGVFDPAINDPGSIIRFAVSFQMVIAHNS